MGRANRELPRATPPRFVVRTTVATLIMIAGVLSAVFVGVTVDVRDRVRKASGTGDVTLGYRFSPEIMVKVGYQGSRSYVATEWDHAAAVSLVFAKRYFD